MNDMSKTPALEVGFDDPEVQQSLRNQCTEDLIAELRATAQRTAAQRTEVWPRR